MSYKSHRSAPGRVFDHLYDPLYTTSGYKDIWRQNNVALATSAPINIYPVYKTMFTDLPRRQRNYFVMLRNPLPHFPPITRTHDVPKRSTIVNGVDRAKFFNNPKTDTKTISLKLDLDSVPKECRCISTQRTVVSQCKAVGCQTMYRETSAQTKPWMPNAIIVTKQPDTPEIVHVADLLHDDVDGTEPGLRYVEIVERARKRRQWEKSLPPILSYEDWHKRHVVLEAFEWEEWVAREHEFEYCQKFRLGLVQKMMTDRDEDNQHNAVSRLESTVQSLKQTKDNKLKSLRINHQRHIRRLQMERNDVKRKYAPANVANEHIEPGSNLYAPQMRFGIHPKHRHFMAFKTHFEARLEGLHNLQMKPSNIKRFIESREDIAKPKGPLKEVKQGLWTDKYLQYLYESLRGLRFKKTANEELAACLKYIKLNSETQLTTPNESTVSISFEEEFQSALVMQKLIKGRSVQLTVCQGLNKYRELISELQSMHQLEAVRELTASDSNILGVQKKRIIVHDQLSGIASLKRAKDPISEGMNEGKGTTMEFMLDFLDKELIRITQQKKAQALCMLAEKERYRRESNEAGLRQCSDERRRENETINHFVEDSKQRLATEFLENVLVDGFEKIAEHDARERIRTTVRNLDVQLESQPNSGAIVSDVLNNYVMPDVMQRIARDNYLTNVQESIFGEPFADHSNLMLNKFIESVFSQESLQSSPISNFNEESEENSMRLAIQRSCEGLSESAAATAGEIFEDIINTIMPEMNVTARSLESDSLQHIMSDINEDIWSYANEDPTFDESIQNENEIIEISSTESNDD